jgi:hypothetical protein
MPAQWIVAFRRSTFRWCAVHSSLTASRRGKPLDCSWPFILPIVYAFEL